MNLLDKGKENNATKCVLYYFSFQVKHFDRKRNYLKFKEQIEKDGYKPLDSNESQEKDAKSWH